MAAPTFVRSDHVSGDVFAGISLIMQLDIGNLVVVGVATNDQSNTGNLTVTDSLGNIYLIAIQGDTFPPDPPAISGQTLLAYTYVTNSGTATITAATSNHNQSVSLLVSQYTRPADLELTQIAHDIGGEPVAGGDTSRGTAPMNYANSLLITFVRHNGTGVAITSLDGDTQRVLTVPGTNATAAIFDAFLTGPGIRNSNIYYHPGGGYGVVAAMWSAPLSRPALLDSQAAVRPGLDAKAPISYGGQPTVKVSLPYMPKAGSTIFVGVMQTFEPGDVVVPTYSVSEDYGNTYNLLAPTTKVDNNMSVAIFQALITQPLPTSGVFSVTLNMDIFSRRKIAFIAEYYINPPASYQMLLFAGSTDIGGGLRRLFTDSVAISVNSLILGFIGGSNDTSNPTTFTDVTGFTIDTHWDTGQVSPSPLANIPKQAVGAFIHRYITVPNTYDAEINTSLAGFSDIIALAIPFAPVGATNITRTASDTLVLSDSFTVTLPGNISPTGVGYVFEYDIGVGRVATWEE